MNRIRAFALAALMFMLAGSSRAVVVAGGTGGEQTSDPGGGFPFTNVGSVKGASGVYLGDFAGKYWVLTASHVVGSGASLGNITLGGTSYSFVPGSGVVIRNSDKSTTDLTLFQIATDPGLPNLTLASVAPATGTTVWLVGYGLRETGSERFWNVTGSGSETAWNSLPNATGANAAGYAIANGGTERYGGSVLVDPSTLSLASNYDIGTGQTRALMTEFQPTIGYAQAASGDSGGALFYDTSGGWELAGILGAVTTFTNQPSNTSVFGQTTYAGDVGFYSATILTAIPEPAVTQILLALAGGGLVSVRRIRRRRRAG
ncbi:MAG TPA: trypsin-like serine protease [Opitutus sp.]|nr:trypsin-like serine protease [Opitutus sp.]